MATARPRAPRVKKVQEAVSEEQAPNSLLGKFVFMEKTLQILNIGIKTEKNIVLYGPGGHGKSEMALEFFYEKNINPYVITMGTGMTTDRLFGGIDIRILDETGKIEYLIDNSFMNHEYVIFEELMDAPDFILEQLKDILSSRIFRNGSQVFPIKTKFIVACTNKTREEFAKNDSLRALMERFPLEHNVIWDNYTEIAYNKLLESKFGEGKVNPVMPFLLQEYTKTGIMISPRIALDSYEIYEECGPDSLMFIAEFARNKELIGKTLKNFESGLKFKKSISEIEQVGATLVTNKLKNATEIQEFITNFSILEKRLLEIKKMTVTDEDAQVHATLVKKTAERVSLFRDKYNELNSKSPSKKINAEGEVEATSV
jgi:hypothetical protein